MEKVNQLSVDSWVGERMAVLGPNPEWQPDLTRGLTLLRATRASGQKRSRKLVWMVAVAAGITVLAMVVPEPRVLAHRCLDCTIAVWQSLSTPASLPANLTPASDRKPAPDFTLQDVSGKSLRLSDLRGKVVLLNFWATWCHGCKIEIPWFIDLAHKYRDQGLTIVGISMDADGWKSVKPFMEARHMNYPVVLGNDDLAAQYGAGSLPVTVMIDHNGKLAASHTGLLSQKTYEAEIQMLLQQKTTGPR